MSAYPGYAGRVIMEVDGELIAAAVAGEYGDAVSTMLMLEAGSRLTCLKHASSHILMESSDWTENTFSGFLYTQL